jgi:predicted lysophospholipase L1 biosynthesis ABC-type transport system permease subunit
MGGAVGYIAWAQARRRGRALAVLAVFIGLVGGVAMSLVAGARRSSSVVDRFFATTIPYDVTQEIVTDIKPSRIVNLHRVRALPIVGMLLAGVMGAVVLLYTLASGVRGRTGELALLRALGLPPRRLSHILAWQGIALAGAALIVGIPLGVVVGSTVWRNIAGQLGVDSTPVLTPLLLSTLLPVTALLVAVLASVIPAARARRQPIAGLLRAE